MEDLISKYPPLPEEDREGVTVAEEDLTSKYPPLPGEDMDGATTSEDLIAKYPPLPKEMANGEGIPSPVEASPEPEKFPEILGMPYDIEAPLRVLMAIPEASASLGKALADEGFGFRAAVDAAHDYTIDNAVDDTVDYLLGLKKDSNLEANYETALKNVDNPAGRGALHVAQIFAHMAGVPTNRAGTGVIMGSAQILRSALKTTTKPSARAFRMAAASSIVRSVTRHVSPVVKGAKDVAVALGGKAVTPIREINTPTAHRLAARLGDDVGQGSGIHSMEMDVWRRTGEFLAPINDALEGYKAGRFINRAVHKKKLNDLETYLRVGKGAAPEGAKEIRDALNKVGKYLVQSKIIKQMAPNWLPRIYNTNYLQTAEGLSHFQTVLAKHGIDRTDSLLMAKGIIKREGQEIGDNVPSKLLAGADGRVMVDKLTEEGNVLNKNSNLNSRIISVPDEELLPFLKHHDNLAERLSTYIHSSVRYAEFANKFGADYGKLTNDIVRINKELTEAKKPALRQDQIDHIYNLADAQLFNYKPLSDTAAGNTVKAINKVVIPAMHILTLPLATVSSMSEVVMPLGRAALRPTATFAGMKGLTSHLTRSVPRAMGFKGIAKSERTRAVEELGIGLDAGIVDMMTQLSRGDTSKVSSLFFKTNFLHQWTRAMMVSANETGKAMIKGHLRDIAANKGNIEAYKKDLAALGVNWKKGVEWIKEGGNTAHPFYDDVKHGGLKFVSDTVMLPRSSQLPIWHSNPRAKVFVQLKSFPTQFGNTVMKNFLNKSIKGTNKERAVVAGTVAGATALGMTSSAINDRIRYGEEGNPRRKNWTTGDYVLDGIDRFGGTGAFSFAKGAYNAQTFGSTATVSLLGPTVSYAEGTLKAVQKHTESVNGNTQALTRQAARFVPFVNVNKHVRESVADTINDLINDNHTTGYNYDDL